MKQKKSELRIYCDLLMQQVHAIKEANTADPPDAEVCFYKRITAVSMAGITRLFFIQDVFPGWLVK